MAEIIEGLTPADRERIRSLRADGRFFWIDVAARDVTREELGEALGIAAHALDPLFEFGRQAPPSRKFHADGEHVVFPFMAFAGEGERGTARLEPHEVHVLVHGEYLLTVHNRRLSLARTLSDFIPEGRSEQYVVYAVLDGMIATAFDALNNAQLAIEGLQGSAGDVGNARVRMGALRAISARLSRMRHQIGPQQGIFERISEEIGQVKGLAADNERYFDRIHDQLRRLLEGIDATSDSLSKLIDLRLNETMYRLTVVATIFLPLSFVTGFFGMNFDWLVSRMDTAAAFLVLGLGIPAAMTVFTYVLIQRRGPVQPDEGAIERVARILHKPRDG